ncbi:MAG: cobalamin biosynthesis protein CbiM [Alphaproteobacteria bacterium CG_4_10_14_0_2_um_filter_63_37]|nr:MAG: cobalamin biosynthesis protein CbiM [Alphaproteobacteria bacterium CG_4_10_14_0_2_um_filter_63_37]
MHIPDGFIAPQMYLPAYGLAAVAWGVAVRRAGGRMADETLPRLAVLTAATFVLMTVMIPLPGGTSIHLSGAALLALIFGLTNTLLAITGVLLLQGLLLGAGGITALPLNALALGLAGPAAGLAVFKLLRSWHEGWAAGAAGWVSINVAAALLALALGVQPLIAHDAAGHPLFFPFGLAIAWPAIQIPHLLVGIGEGVLTATLWQMAKVRGWTV